MRHQTNYVQYSAADREAIIRDYGIVPTKELAAIYNTTPGAIRSIIYIWRKDPDIAESIKPVPEGTIATRNVKGVPTQMIRRLGKWRPVTKKILNLKKPVPPKLPKAKSAPAPRNAPIRTPKRLPTRVIDLTGMKRIHIPKMRMHVWVPADAVEAEVLQRFAKG